MLGRGGISPSERSERGEFGERNEREGPERMRLKKQVSQSSISILIKLRSFLISRFPKPHPWNVMRHDDDQQRFSGGEEKIERGNLENATRERDLKG